MAQIIEQGVASEIGYTIQSVLDTNTGEITTNTIDQNNRVLQSVPADQALEAAQQNLALVRREDPELVPALEQIVGLITKQINSLRNFQASQAESSAQEAEAEAPSGPTAQPPQVQTDGDTQPVDTNQTPTNAVTPATDEDSGLDQPVKTLEQTQATGNTAPEEAYRGFSRSPDGSFTVGIEGSTAPTNPGKGQLDDTSPTPSTPAVNSEQIVPRDNVLDSYHSATYQASVYLLSQDQFNEFQRTGKRNVSGYNLLFQSGGAAQGAYGGLADTGVDKALRNPNFDVDYYIDSITMVNRLFGRQTQAAHSVAELKFTVIEPANISLLDRLYQAVQDSPPPNATGVINYASSVYLMVIRFYGYDVNGRPEAAREVNAQGLSDPNAVVEKFVPFRIRHINWTVSNQLVSYEFDCAPIGQIVTFGTRRGVIPADIELSGSTVQSMLAGEVVYSTAQAPFDNPGASTAASDTGEVPGATTSDRDQTDPGYVPPPKANTVRTADTIKQGLIKALNDHQQRLVKQGVQQLADIYEIDFGKGADEIKSALVSKPGKKKAKDYTPGSVPVSKGNTSGLSPDKQSMDTSGRNFALTAGMPVVQVIDLIIRNSSYIYEQATVVYDETSKKYRPNPRSGAREMKWYTIIPTVQQLGYDAKRLDYAYRIHYCIMPYNLVDFNSPYFPPGKYRGVHKKYPYWFTGQNTAVLDYTASFNKLYNLTVSGGTLEESVIQRFRDRLTSSTRDVPFVAYQARSTESDAGADGKANEQSANAAEYLYNPADNGNTKITIIGDPAWIQQGSLAGGFNCKDYNFSYFLPDGTISFETNDVMFEIAWQRPEDYDVQTGLADPYSRTSKTFGNRDPIQSAIYRCKQVTSRFIQGKFTQDLEGTLYLYPTPQGTNKAADQSQNVNPQLDGSDADAERETNPNIAQGIRPPSIGTDALDAARLGNLGKNSPLTGGNLYDLNQATGSKTFDALSDQVNDIVPSLPAQPATSDTENISSDQAEATRIQRESGDPNAITAEQVASNRRLNETLTGLLPIPRLPNPGTETTVAGTQDIVRET